MKTCWGWIQLMSNLEFWLLITMMFIKKTPCTRFLLWQTWNKAQLVLDERRPFKSCYWILDSDSFLCDKVKFVSLWFFHRSIRIQVQDQTGELSVAADFGRSAVLKSTILDFKCEIFGFTIDWRAVSAADFRRGDVAWVLCVRGIDVIVIKLGSWVP